MKKEKTEELFVKWIDGRLSPNEERELTALIESDPELKDDLSEMQKMSRMVREEVPASVEPPYGDFFNSQLMRKVDLDKESQRPSKKAARWWSSLRWAWAPVGAMALVLAFFAGQQISRPAAALGNQVATVDTASALPSVYFAGESLETEMISDSTGEVSVIVVNGLTAIGDEIDFVTVATSASLPESYDSSEARRFH